MTIKQNHGTPFTAVSTGTATAIATYTVGSTQTIFITDIVASSDKGTATCIIQSGSTTIWNDRISNTMPYIVNLIQPIPCSVGATLTATVTGASVAYINISGFLGNNS